ncbi:MAG: hypothetical protein R3F14_41375 [Polyangiaceae bacterium]
MLEGIGVCAAGLYDDVATAADTFSGATAAAAVHRSGGVASRARCLVVLIDLWQRRPRSWRVGPAGPTTTGRGGAPGLRVFTALVSRCLVEQKLAAKSYEASDFFSTALVNMRGWPRRNTCCSTTGPTTRAARPPPSTPAGRGRR